MSALGWVDFSSEHREKVKSVIDLLSTPGVIDELGIGAIRDAFSDSLFPGLSTTQTRATYFLSVPRIFKDYEKLPTSKRLKKKLSEYLNEHENQCMLAMVNNHQDDRQNGIIGESFANKQGEVQRKPSSVYWSGIRQFGLIKTTLSLEAFSRRFANPDQPLLDLVQGSDKTKGDDPDASEQINATINGSSYQDNWIEDLRVYLSKDEASFLSRQIEARVPNSLLGQILLDPAVRRAFLDLSGNWSFSEFAEEAPFLHKFPKDLQRIIHAARDFWHLMYGAHIRYNCLLQARHGTKDRQAEFDRLWNDWIGGLDSFQWDRWETDFLWKLTESHNSRVHEYTVHFVKSWIEGVRARADISLLDKLVERQERSNKKSRARLHPSANESVSDWVGIRDLNYRLNVARLIVNDIDHGLTSMGGDDA